MPNMTNFALAAAIVSAPLTAASAATEHRARGHAAPYNAVPPPPATRASWSARLAAPTGWL